MILREKSICPWDKMRTASGTTGKGLAQAVSEALEAKLVDMEIRMFPDGDQYVRTKEDLKGETVVLVQSPFQDSGIVQHRLIQDSLKRAGAEKIISVAPYVSYSRQDKNFKQGEAVSAPIFIEWLSHGCDHLIVVDIHNPAVLEKMENVRNVIPHRSFARFIEGRADLVLAPDKGAIKRAKSVAEDLGVECDYLEKTRLSDRSVEIKTSDVDVSGKKVAIIDDIISTGGTMMEASRQLKLLGAEKVYGLATHGMFTEEDLEKLEMNMDLVSVTRSIETRVSDIDMSLELADVVRGL